MTTVKFHCNYCSDFDIYNRVLGMTPKNSGVWKNVKVTFSDDYDIFVIMNYPQHNQYDPKRTIVFESETPTTRNNFPKFYQDRKDEFLYVHDTRSHFNVDLWYHGLSYDEIFNKSFDKRFDLSVINSNLNNLPGHVYRNNFINALSNNIEFDMFGRFHSNNRFYKGPLEKKYNGLAEYRYTFNCENDFEDNYFTEKLLDGIFCECLTFYFGCPNVKSFVDERSFIQLCGNLEDDIYTIKNCMSKKYWDYRIQYIKNEKIRIAEEYNVLNIINNILEKL